MVILDENIAKSQRIILLKQGIKVKQIGFDIEFKGIKDEEIIVVLLTLNKPTLISWDRNLYTKKFCNKNYCIAYLDVHEDEVANFAKRFLKHKEFNTKNKRNGKIVKITASEIRIWKVNKEREKHINW